MRRMIVGWVLLLAAFADVAAGQSPITGWGKLRFGMSREDIRKVYDCSPEAFFVENGVFVGTLKNPSPDVLSVLCRLSPDDKLYQIHVYIKAGPLQPVLDVLTEAYGPCQSIVKGERHWRFKTVSMDLWVNDGSEIPEDRGLIEMLFLNHQIFHGIKKRAEGEK